jgi:hypothetical protein
MSAAAAYQTTDKDAIIAAEFGGARELLKMDRSRRGKRGAKKAKDAELVALLDEPVSPFEVPAGADRQQGRDARIWKVEVETISPKPDNTCLFNAVATAMGKFKKEKGKMQPDYLWVQRMVHAGLRIIQVDDMPTEDDEARRFAMDAIWHDDIQDEEEKTEEEQKEEEEKKEAEQTEAEKKAAERKKRIQLLRQKKERYAKTERFQDCSMGGPFELFLFSWAFDGHIRFRVLREDNAEQDALTIGKDGCARDGLDLNRSGEEDVHEIVLFHSSEAEEHFDLVTFQVSDQQHDEAGLLRSWPNAGKEQPDHRTWRLKKIAECAKIAKMRASYPGRRAKKDDIDAADAAKFAAVMAEAAKRARKKADQAIKLAKEAEANALEAMKEATEAATIAKDKAAAVLRRKNAAAAAASGAAAAAAGAASSSSRGPAAMELDDDNIRIPPSDSDLGESDVGDNDDDDGGNHNGGNANAAPQQNTPRVEIDLISEDDGDDSKSEQPEAEGRDAAAAQSSVFNTDLENIPGGGGISTADEALDHQMGTFERSSKRARKTRRGYESADDDDDDDASDEEEEEEEQQEEGPHMAYHTRKKQRSGAAASSSAAAAAAPHKKPRKPTKKEAELAAMSPRARIAAELEMLRAKLKKPPSYRAAPSSQDEAKKREKKRQEQLKEWKSRIAEIEEQMAAQEEEEQEEEEEDDDDEAMPGGQGNFFSARRADPFDWDAVEKKWAIMAPLVRKRQQQQQQQRPTFAASSLARSVSRPAWNF